MTGYITVITAVVSFVITALSGKFLIPYLRKVKFGQTIKEIGPTWHQMKQGTPTMGGFMFILGIVIAVIVGLFLTLSSIDENDITVTTVSIIKMFAGLLLALAFGFVGFVDDYIKVVKKRNLGLKARQKIFMQIFITVMYLLILYLVGNSTIIEIPFTSIQLNLGLFYYPIMGLAIIFIVNAVNLTDGIDGLAGSVTFIVGLGFMVITTILQQTSMNILATALAGGCLGFLVWNFYPAKVFMGDTGSMFLGGAVVGLAFGIDKPVIILLVGIIYIIEALSVVIQVISFKLTGKRVFKMSPIHHHYEMSGYTETKIVGLFTIVTTIFCVLAIISVILILR